jgi:hypothetical protein
MGMQISPRPPEQSEAEQMYEFETGAAGLPAGRAGLRRNADRRGGVALSMRHDPSGYWSKALGFGFAEPVTHELIDEVRSFYRTRTVPHATVQIAPSLLPANWRDICAKMNLEEEGATYKLASRIETAVRDASTFELGSDLSVTGVDAQSANEWSQVMPIAMGMSSIGFSDMAHGSVGRSGWFPFAVRDAGDAIVATAAMRVHGLGVTLFAGCTLPEARRRGAQSTLIAARARAAQSAGCEWLVAKQVSTPQNNATRHIRICCDSALTSYTPGQTGSGDPVALKELDRTPKVVGKSRHALRRSVQAARTGSAARSGESSSSPCSRPPSARVRDFVQLNWSMARALDPSLRCGRCARRHLSCRASTGPARTDLK